MMKHTRQTEPGEVERISVWFVPLHCHYTLHIAQRIEVCSILVLRIIHSRHALIGS